MTGRFQKGQSGNPAGRPKKRRPHVSAFDIVFDKMLTVTQNGSERELTVDEALQLKTYQAALKGSKMAVRAVLKMIEKREAALAARAPAPAQPRQNPYVVVYDSDSADEAMQLLGIAAIDEAPTGMGWGHRRLKLTPWAAQAAISRPGRRSLTEKKIQDIKLLTCHPELLKLPRNRSR